MTTVLAPHHTTKIGDCVADRYGNDPFVWISPFVWSHCHARSRSHDFGSGAKGALVNGKDTIFFVNTDPETEAVSIDCVFVIAEKIPIAVAESRFSDHHPVRHYHFDHERSPHHLRSKHTYIADSDSSFIPCPPMPLGAWIENHVKPATMPVIEYFRLTKRKNVRVVITNAQAIYDNLLKWSKLPGHSALTCLPLQTLKDIKPGYPAKCPIDWNDD